MDKFFKYENIREVLMFPIFIWSIDHEKQHQIFYRIIHAHNIHNFRNLIFGNFPKVTKTNFSKNERNNQSICMSSSMIRIHLCGPAGCNDKPVEAACIKLRVNPWTWEYIDCWFFAGEAGALQMCVKSWNTQPSNRRLYN